MTEWMRGNELEMRRAGGDLGGTMRLGAYEAVLEPGSKVAEIYGATRISERHRHRYEVNTRYKHALGEGGLAVLRHVAGRAAAGDHRIPEPSAGSSACSIIPSSNRRPFEPHPLFASFIAAAVEQSRLV